MPSPRHYPRAIAFLALLLCACVESVLEPVNTRQLEPPAIYRTWWSEVEACTGVTGRFERVRWLEADVIRNREKGTEHVGAWDPPHTIYIQSDRLLYERGVKHEMVHDLRQTANHGSSAFRRCAG
ncbi:MAG TPA: hypothetical protein VIS76_01560 [Pseudomonadales bacterium]